METLAASLQDSQQLKDNLPVAADAVAPALAAAATAAKEALQDEAMRQKQLSQEALSGTINCAQTVRLVCAFSTLMSPVRRSSGGGRHSVDRAIAGAAGHVGFAECHCQRQHGRTPHAR